MGRWLHQYSRKGVRTGELCYLWKFAQSQPFIKHATRACGRHVKCIMNQIKNIIFPLTIYHVWKYHLFISCLNLNFTGQSVKNLQAFQVLQTVFLKVSFFWFSGCAWLKTAGMFGSHYSWGLSYLLVDRIQFIDSNVKVPSGYFPICKLLPSPTSFLELYCVCYFALWFCDSVQTNPDKKQTVSCSIL